MEFLISGIVIVDVGPFVTDPETGDISNERGDFPKHILDDNGAWRVVEIADEVIPADFALGRYVVDTSNVFTKLPGPPAASPEVPEVVTMRQARLALLSEGVLATVNDAVSTLTGPQGDAARIEWEFSSQVYRSRPLVLAIAQMLGWDDAKLDRLFIHAATL